MTTKEMKDILATKLHDEGCYFTKSDISIRKSGNNYKIIIKDYEHMPFTVKFETDDYFGFCVLVYADKYNIIFVDSKRKYDIETALIRLGYYIGTRF